MSEAVYIFKPGDDTYKDEYPELKEVDEFKEIPDKQLKVVWYYANRTSPFFNIKQDKRRWDRSVSAVYPIEDDAGLKMVRSGHTKKEIMKAIKRMKDFRPTIRYEAKVVLDTMFTKMKSIVQQNNVDLEQLTMAERKAYIEMCLKFTNELPAFIESVERGFAVKVEEVKQQVNTKKTRADIAMDIEENESDEL